MGAEWAKAYKSGETFEIESTPKLRKDDSLVKEHKKVKKKRKKKATVKSTKERHEITSRASIHTESIIESEVEGSNFKSYRKAAKQKDFSIIFRFNNLEQLILVGRKRRS